MELDSALLSFALLRAHRHSNAAELVVHLAQNIKSVLRECYGDKEAVTDELVDCILKPGLEACRIKHVVSPVVITTDFSATSCMASKPLLMNTFSCLLMQPGAVEVFLDFISYSGGPLPEELLPQTACPVSILWGEADPWEPIELGRAYADYDCVEEFIPLPGAPCEIHLRPAPMTVVC